MPEATAISKTSSRTIGIQLLQNLLAKTVANAIAASLDAAAVAMYKVVCDMLGRCCPAAARVLEEANPVRSCTSTSRPRT